RGRGARVLVVPVEAGHSLQMAGSHEGGARRVGDGAVPEVELVDDLLSLWEQQRREGLGAAHPVDPVDARPDLLDRDGTRGWACHGRVEVEGLLLLEGGAVGVRGRVRAAVVERRTAVVKLDADLASERG